MNLNEFKKEFGINPFILMWPKTQFEKELSFLGWNLAQPIMAQEVSVVLPEDWALIRADFYPEDHLLAISRRSEIRACGETIFVIDGITYRSIQEAVNSLGWEILQHLETWEWKEQKEWIVIMTKSSRFLSSFDCWDKAPQRLPLERNAV